MQAKKLVGTIVALCALTAPVSAATSEYFLGWTKDGGTTYVIDYVNRADGWKVFCPVNPKAKPFIPAGVKTSLPERGGDEGCLQPDPYISNEEISKLLIRPDSSNRGPHGEHLTLEVKKQKGNEYMALITVYIGNRKVTREVSAAKGAKLGDIYWRADGGAVAIQIPTKDGRNSNDQTNTYAIVINLSARNKLP